MLTRIFSLLKTQKPFDRSTAIGFLTMNLTALPGLGSVAAGRRVGYYQMGFSILGLVMFIVWLIFFALRIVRTGEYSVGEYVWVGLMGITLNAGAWLWSLITGLSIIREVKKNE